ncbi:MAG: zinc ribbon domain-containing protein [Oscillospiraceae bacterium]
MCSGYRHYSKSCTCHYIRVEVVEQLILDAIRRASRYAIENEAAFIQRVREEAALQQEAAVREMPQKADKGQTPPRGNQPPDQKTVRKLRRR